MDYTDIFCQAVDTIVSQRLSSISYDITKICTIIDNSQRHNGKYTVTADGVLNFEAYSEKTTYLVGDKVRVTIPNGDYSQEKFIESKYSTKDNLKPITYISPLDSVLDTSGNLIDSSKIEGLRANGANVKGQGDKPVPEKILLYNIDFTKSKYSDIQNNDLYSTLFIKADFRCLLSEYRIRSGSYGVAFEITVDQGGVETQKFASLDIDDMFGNPYSFSLWSTQEKKFDIKDIGIIKNINLYFYQGGDFSYLDNETKELKYFDESSFLEGFYNILIKNIYVGLGSEVSLVEDDIFQLYTPNELTYDSNDLQKNIGYYWFNKSDENEYLGFSDGVYIDENNLGYYNYDEINYLETKKTDTRLLAQKGKKNIPIDENGLELAADVEEITEIINKAHKYWNTDTYNLIKLIQNKCKDIAANEDMASIFKELLDVSDGKIRTLGEQLETRLGWLTNKYNDILADTSKSDYQKPESLDKYDKVPELNDKGTEYKMHLYISETLENMLLSLEKFLKDFGDIVDTKYKGFKDIYQTYKIRIGNREDRTGNISQVLAYKEQYESLIDNNKTILDELILNGQQEEYQAKDFSVYDNKYCLYWFKYEPNYYDTTEYAFLGRNWKRLEEKTNVGLPTTYDEVRNEIQYLPKKPNAEESFLSFDCDLILPSEKITAVLFYNHQIIKASNVIEFINNEQAEDTTIIDQVSAIRIEHGENSSASYQLYGIDNQLLNFADRNKKRNLRVRYNGVDKTDEALIGTQIYWYVPKNSTMLSYNIKELTDLGFSITENDSEIPLDKQGYASFYKIIEDESDTIFQYKIENYYSPSFSQNHIICKVITGDFSAEAATYFTFNSYGTNGTNYSLCIEPTTEQSAVIAPGSGEESGSLVLKVNVYDYNNEPIDTSDITPILNWFGCSGYSCASDNGLEKIVISRENDCRYGVLSATVPISTEEDNNYELTSYYPIAYSSASYYIEGATNIIYDTSGANPSYYKEPFKIFYNYNDIENGIVAGQEITNVEWKIIYYDKDGAIKTPDVLSASFMPKIKVYKNQYYLQAANTYVGDVACYPVVVCKVKTEDDSGEKLWHQSIFITQNRWGSSLLNNWDGNLTIDEKNGLILSNMVGAGRKNEDDNTFSGVLMGDVEAKADVNDNATGIGLYGYHHGAQSFNFSVDGTGFLGKSGAGRIYINGDHGYIKSGNWDGSFRVGNKGSEISKPGTKGTFLDLTNGHIDAANFKLTSNGINLNSTPTEEENYLLIGNQENEYIKYTGKNELIIKVSKLEISGTNKDIKDYIDSQDTVLDNSFNYEKVFNRLTDNGNIKGIFMQNNQLYINANYIKTGVITSENNNMTINLNNGEISAKSFSLDSTYLDISKEGKITATEADIKGKITATSGEFTGSISGSKISGGTITGGTISGGSISGATISGGSLSISSSGASFSVNGDGVLTAKGCYIEGNGTFGGTITSNNANITGGYLKVGNNFEVKSDGTLTATGGKIGGWIISGTSLSSPGLVLYSSNPNGVPSLEITGNGYINVASYIRLSGNTGKIYIGNGNKHLFFSTAGTLRLSEGFFEAPGISVTNLHTNEISVIGTISNDELGIGTWCPLTISSAVEINGVGNAAATEETYLSLGGVKITPTQLRKLLALI